MNSKNIALVGVISAALMSGIYYWEGTRYIPYKDIVGVLTVCQGYTGKDIVIDRKYTKEECDFITKRELISYNAGVLKCINVPITPYELDAYTLFAYNVGISAFCNSKGVLGNLNKGNHKAACDGLLQWTYAKGQYVQGLYNRRSYERKMCLGELNATTQ